MDGVGERSRDRARPVRTGRRSVKSFASGSIREIALLAAHCDDIAIGAGGTLLTIARANPGLTVHALVLTGGGGAREVEEKTALAAFLPGADVRLTVTDIPDGRSPAHWDAAKDTVAAFRRTCEPDVVFAPQKNDAHQDHRQLATLAPTEFRDHMILGYEILKWESDLPTPSLYHPISDEIAREKVELLHASYPSQTDKDWFDADAFLGLCRIRGVQCKSRYAEAFVVEKTVIDFVGA
ncbi:PIG-L family deacetylase [Rhodococcus sp. BP-252]|nr:PIG-L family deacetylase [Rhodococcus sp. BP-320]MBY6416805.1 PIG-L family deacetylase [Rhodococcus sp. BP-321]MBY6421657.1 PIG-L family deacetylase [Rhodococcus sp. BP-324]MBY6426923.1 PIG-L family deacetylase [Rhodococcus sp. BP-323]MBY6432089.1 PIG-L family deacetylase [Rhodococcus sp. BP-322]MBY6440897.1 PIG-L family deacetylase [Rhodococcus sp. BP-319]MBY6446037.1 PIG-L family deacetylase [Rhodococcus sp. BP-318]MBY6450836.1 PIG-L family deacetylase [Rhodococcus sp. BP-315]MBY645552